MAGGDFRTTDARAELLGALDHSGVDYKEDSEGARFSLKSGGRVWDVVCRCRDDTVTVCSVYPFEIVDGKAADEIVRKANAELLRGCLYFQDKRPIVRTFADAFEAYTAKEAIVRAIEDCAAIAVRYYTALMACAD